MRLPIGRRLLVLSALVLVVSTALAPSAAAKGKRTSCKGTQVAVKAGKRTTCRPFAKVFPQPRDLDLRLSYLRQTLEIDPAKLAGGKKKKKRIRPPERRLRKKVERVLPKALAFFDRKRGAAASSSSPLGGAAFASANCGTGQAGARGSIGGSSSVGLLGDNGMFIETEALGLTIRLSFVSCGGVGSFSVPPCPKSTGSVDAQGSGDFRVTIEIWEGSRLVKRNTTSWEDKADVHGEVGPDAKLKFIKVTHQQEMFIVATGGIVVRGGLKREIRIEMPGGQYDPASAKVTPFGDSVTADFGADAFAKTAAAALGSYRSAEAGWSTFGRGNCAEPVFAPAANAEKLRRGDQKQVSVYARARADGGRATEARWSLLAPLNAEFSPVSSQDAAPTIAYTVAKTPAGNQVRVTARVTSTAGVGERSWTQPIDSSVGQIEGSFGGEMSAETALEEPSVQQWTGVVKFSRLVAGEGGGPNGLYSVVSGNVAIDLSGIESSSITGCHQSGSAQGPVSGSMNVTGTGPDNGPPYEYGITLSMPFVPVHAFRVAPCPKAAQDEGYEGTEFDATPAWKLSVSGQESGDGAAFGGTEDESFGGLTYIQNWNLHATE
jgi:hypothetical protein